VFSSPRFAIRTDAEGVLWLSGELDLSQMDVLAETAAATLNGQRMIVLELSDLTFCDSSGIRAILRLAQTVPDGVMLRNVRDNVKTVLEIAGVDGASGVRVDPDSSR